MKIHLWDMKSGSLVGILETECEKQGFILNRVAFTPDSSKIVVAGDSVSLYDVQNKKLLSILVETKDLPPGENSPNAFKLDGGLVAAGNVGRRGVIKVWRIDPLTEIARLDIGDECVSSIAISPDGKMIAATSKPLGYGLFARHNHGTIGVWQIDPATEIARFDLDSSRVSDITFSPDGKTIAVVKDKDVLMWRTSAEKRLDVLKGHAWIDLLAFGHDGKLLIRACDEENYEELSKELNRLKEEAKKKGGADSGAIEKATRAAETCGTIKFWDVEKLELLQTIQTRRFRHIAPSPDGRLIATSGEESEVVFLYGAPEKQ